MAVNPFESLERKIDRIESNQQEIFKILTTKMMDELLNYQELSELTGLAVQTLRAKKSRGEIPYIMIDGTPRFRRKDIVEKWMKEFPLAGNRED